MIPYYVAEWRPCPVPGCEREIRPYQRLCAKHWHSLPKTMRTDISRGRVPLGDGLAKAAARAK